MGLILVILLVLILLGGVGGPYLGASSISLGAPGIGVVGLLLIILVVLLLTGRL